MDHKSADMVTWISRFGEGVTRKRRSEYPTPSSSRKISESSARCSEFHPRGRLRQHFSSDIAESDRPTSECGFTLIEVVIALAIFTLSITTLYQSIAGSLWTSARAEASAQSAIVARSLLSRAGTELPLEDADIAGTNPDGSLWRLRIQASTESRLDQTAFQVYEVRAEVAPAHTGASSVVLNTLKLGPKRPVR